MRIFLDACVLFPTVTREMLLGVARAGVFEPQWSPRVLEEWARATLKIGPKAEIFARGEIAMLKAAWPRAEVQPTPALQSRLWLPDDNDIHVLAAAVAGSADAIMTVNAKDFPRNILSEEGLTRIDPDGYLFQAWQASPEIVGSVANGVLKTARDLSGEDWQMRSLFKKARLPCIAKALSQ
jgi:predicted nucleic acid-binding protein